MPSRKHDQCPVCGHHLEAFDDAWKRMRSNDGLLICANYCTQKTCGVKGCRHDCEHQLVMPEVAERVLGIMKARTA